MRPFRARATEKLCERILSWTRGSPLARGGTQKQYAGSIFRIKGPDVTLMGY